MTERKITCIICPRGCEMTVSFTEDGKIREVVGNACKRGLEYATTECTAPKRTVTSTVKCEGGGVVAVKTSSPIPKHLIFDVMKKINSTQAKKEVKIGDVIIKNVLDTGSDIVAAANKTN